MVHPQRAADTKQQPMKNIVGLSILAVTCLHSGCCHNRNGISGTADYVLPPNWKPSVGVTQDYFVEQLEGFKHDQMMLTVLTTQEAILSDARLFQVYVGLWECLDGDGRTRLFEEQRDWLEQRPNMAHARNEYPEGSIAPMTFNIAYTEITRERRLELEERLERLR